MENRQKVAIIVNNDMAKSIFNPADYHFLTEFADVNPLDELPEQITADDMYRLLPGAAACITCWGTPSFTDNLLDDMKSLRLIAHAAGSVKNLVPESFWSRTCRITSNAPIIAEDVAQTTLALILGSLKQLWGFSMHTHKGQWSGGEAARFTTRRLEGLQVGVVGASHVGREVIRLLRPFGCSICLSDPYTSPLEAAALGVRLIELDELIATSDVLTLHTPANPDCVHLISAQNAPLIKDGACWVPTASPKFTII